jgi:Family of unknown function (DUF5988)
MDVLPNVVLRGGPDSGLSDDERLRYVAEPVDKVKVARGHRYEHFERSTDTWADPDGNELRVYEWIGFTRVAE